MSTKKLQSIYALLLKILLFQIQFPFVDVNMSSS